ncbi:uncharacterized protein E0L32_005151 [Thyridium curvatum]|uniref:Zn(2)-C6 fungal-type domain-containing protein n=1 Tax=Thyridium curvatum TaxID=1093900 RepID=A0A507B6M0_9PEZI|nr:uncharacterized protein E0L32_005151 [Thyridium curvatum]TPX14756.1 hypothetical protein E0L32_005151 [Thyridium curvatum]
MAQTTTPEGIGQFTHIFRAEGFGAKQTCRQCRSRKVRCDGNRDGCGHCSRLGFDCSFKARETGAGLHTPESRGSADHPETAESSRPPKRRVTRACVRCRQQKIRCTGTLPSCINCVRRNQQCQYAAPKRPLRDPLDPTSPTGDYPLTMAPAPWNPPPETACLCRETVRLVLQDIGEKSPPNPETTTLMSQLRADLSDKIEAYFQSLYPLPSYTFLHPGTIKVRLHEGTLDKALILSLYGTSVLHTRTGLNAAPSCACRGYSWIKEAEEILWQQLERPTISRMQALLLVILYRMETGHFQRAFMLTGIAAREGLAMRLNVERPDLPDIPRETRRRMAWALKLIERYFSIGVAEFQAYPLGVLRTNRPGHEEDFGCIGAEGSPTGEEGDGGSFNLLVETDQARGTVWGVAKQLPQCEDPLKVMAEQEETTVNNLARIQSRFVCGPDLTPAKLVTMLHSRWLPRHILVYLSWHQTYCDLYRLYVVGLPEAAPKAVLDAVDPALLARAESLCHEHAAAIIQILTSLNQLSTTSQPLEFDTAICAYHATRIVLFISRFGRQPNRYGPDFALSRADLCLAALRRFFPASVLVRPIINELERMVRIFSARTGVAPQPQDAAQGRPAPKIQEDDVRHKLAIHSLLRQADFSDDEEESSPATTADTPRTALSQQQQRLSQQSPPQHQHQQEHAAAMPVGGGDGPVADSITVMGSGTAGPEDTLLHAGELTATNYEFELPDAQGWSEFDNLPPEQTELLQFPLFPWNGWQGQQDQDWTFGSGM